MKAVIQRVKSASLSVEGMLVSEIGTGLVVFLGVGRGDGESEVDRVAKKIVGMRIFKDENDKMNLSVKDIRGEILLVSQFTLYGDCTHGNRPSFFGAEQPEAADALYELCASRLKEYGVPVKCGVFGADMQIKQHNDGPVTIILEI